MRVGVVVCLVILALAWAAAAPAAGPVFAAAAAEGDKDAKHGGKHDEHKDEIDVFKGGIELTIWSIVVFLILFALLSKFAWPQIREGLDRREQAIAHDKQEAVKAKQEADTLRTQLKAEMDKVNDQIRVMMDKARKDAEALIAEREAQSKAEMMAEYDRKRRDLALQETDALHKMWEQSAQLATIISGKVIHKQLQYDDHRALVNEALAEFRQAAQARKQDLESARA